MPFFLGMFCAIVATLYVTFQLVAFCLPVYHDVTAANLNWAFLFAVVGILGIILGWVFHGRHMYIGQLLVTSARTHDDQDQTTMVEIQVKA